MLDPIIRELFPQQSTNAFTQEINSENAPLSNERFFAPPDYYRSVLDFDTGEYNLAIRYSYYIAYAFPSGFAQENLLYLQLLASELTSEKHFTRRNGLHSFLCAQTFSGRGILRYEGKVYVLEPGDIFLIDCLKPHEYRADSADGWGYRIIHFNGVSMRGIFEQFRHKGIFVFHFGNNHAVFHYTKELFVSRYKDDPDMEIEEHRLLTSLVAELLKQLPQYTSMGYPDRIIAIQRYLNMHCTEKLTLNGLSQYFHMSKYYLSREFKKHTGETVFQYITRCRMDVATYLLVNSRQTIEQISQECGFSEVNSFFYAFKKFTRLSPSEYRNKH